MLTRICNFSTSHLGLMALACMVVLQGVVGVLIALAIYLNIRAGRDCQLSLVVCPLLFTPEYLCRHDGIC